MEIFHRCFQKNYDKHSGPLGLGRWKHSGSARRENVPGQPGQCRVGRELARFFCEWVGLSIEDFGCLWFAGLPFLIDASLVDTLTKNTRVEPPRKHVRYFFVNFPQLHP